MKNKVIPDKYNYLKSIKEKEQKVLEYYKKSVNIQDKPKPIPKPKKRTKKNIKVNIKVNIKNNELLEDMINDEDSEKTKHTLHQKEQDKKTKKQIVIMDD